MKGARVAEEAVVWTGVIFAAAALVAVGMTITLCACVANTMENLMQWDGLDF
jgi:hypothetical protein